MQREEVLNKMTELVTEQFDVDSQKVNGQLNFQNDLDADSIDFVEFVLDLEETFNAEISDEDAEKLTTIDEAVDYIVGQQAQAS